MATCMSFLRATRSMAPLLALWLALAVTIQFCHERILAILSRQGSTAGGADLIPRPEVFKYMTLGYDQLLSDIWWLSFIQYYGDNKARDLDHYRLAYRYLDLITQLDPRFTQPYWFAAFAVGCDFKHSDMAAKLIERGILANQDNWYLPFIAGINQYLFAHDDLLAAKYYRRAARYPDAPSWLSRQAKVLEAQGPLLFKEINTWACIYNSSNETLVKRHAAARLKELWLIVYKTVPGESTKKRAEGQLRALGVDLCR